MPKLTKRLIEAIEPESKDVIIRDSDLKGFLCKVTPKGKCVYMLYYRTKSGRERRPTIGIHGQITCEQARDTARIWLADIAQGGDPSGDKISHKKTPTVSELGERYMSEHGKHLKKRSYDETDRIWKRYIIPNVGNIKIGDITQNDVSKLHQQYADKPYMANRVLEVLSSAFNFADRWGIYHGGSNPCKHVKKFKEKSRERFLSKEELSRLNTVLSDAKKHSTELPSVIAAIRLLIFTGCRLNEILTLKWEYIDHDNHCLRLPDSKTGAKTVYLAPYAMELLSNIPRQDDNPYVIIGKVEGEHLINIQKPWRRIRREAGLDDVRLHDLRHSFISMGAANGLSLPILGALAGHKHSQTTQRYAHLIGDPLRDAAKVIGTEIESAMNVNEEFV